MACRAGMLNRRDLNKNLKKYKEKTQTEQKTQTTNGEKKNLSAFVLLLSRSLSSRRRLEKTWFIPLLAGRRKARSPQRVPAQVGALGGG